MSGQAGLYSCYREEKPCGLFPVRERDGWLEACRDKGGGCLGRELPWAMFDASRGDGGASTVAVFWFVHRRFTRRTRGKIAGVLMRRARGYRSVLEGSAPRTGDAFGSAAVVSGFSLVDGSVLRVSVLHDYVKCSLDDLDTSFPHLKPAVS